jgi:hypothetical protein
VPALQSDQALQLVEFGAVLKVPALHPLQV